MIETFLKTWIEQFGRALAMFNGKEPTLSCEPEQIRQPFDLQMLWVKQEFAAGAALTLWVGAGEAAWSTLGAGLGDSTPEGLRSTYLEILGQALQGAANAASAGRSKRIDCKGGAAIAEPDFDPATASCFSLAVDGNEELRLSLAMELTEATGREDGTGP